MSAATGKRALLAAVGDPPRKRGRKPRPLGEEAQRRCGDLLQAGLSDRKVCELIPEHSRTKVQEELQRMRSPVSPCFKVATLGDVKVMFADIRKTLQLLVEAVPLFHDKMEEWHDRAVRCALYFDEVQAGNILAPLPSKKAGFFYLGFPDFGVAWRNSPRAWVTLGMLPYLDHQNVPGGYTAYLHLLLEELDLARNAFPVARGIKISLFLAMYIADHDAQKIVFDNTGSAGLAPCLFCANICKLNADLAGRDADGLLRDITEDNVRRFVRKQDEDWFKLVDDLHRDVCSMRLTKKAVKQRSQCLGINYRPDSGHLFQARYRHLLPPSYCFNDYLHAYFQGGCAAVETTRLVERVLSRTLLNLEDVAEMARMNWKAARHVTSAGPQGRADFFHERRFRSCYVGSGGEQIQMMPLLLFTLCRLLLPRGELQQELECYSLLVQITHCYRWLHHTEKISNTSRLQLLATELKTRLLILLSTSFPQQ